MSPENSPAITHTDRSFTPWSGLAGLTVLLLLVSVGLVFSLQSLRIEPEPCDARWNGDGCYNEGEKALHWNWWWATATLLVGVLAVWALNLLKVLDPNETIVLLFFGRYIGTVRAPGWYVMPPLTDRYQRSIRTRVHESEILKVNDHDGNPVEAATVVSWRIADAAKSVLDVDDVDDYVSAQTDAALRAVVSAHSYDSVHHPEESLRGGTDRLAEKIRSRVAEKLAPAGVEVIDARISHLAYAPEIASIMLQRQQAKAVLDARKTLVQGAVEIAKEAARQLNDGEHGPDAIAERRKLAANLLVVLVGDQAVQPILNAGGN